MALQAAVQRRPRQVREGGLKGIQAVIQRQQGMPTEGDHDGLVLCGEHGGLGLLRPGRQAVDCVAAVPLGNGFGLLA